MIKTRTNVRQLPDPGLEVAIADAHAAADAAAGIASGAYSWAARADVGADDAAEAVRCALRARTTAQQAEHCATAVDAWACARLAWAAVTSALEASARVNISIAEALAAA
jgi:hypothetical protein